VLCAGTGRSYISVEIAAWTRMLGQPPRIRGVVGWRFYDWGPSPLMREMLEQLAGAERRRPGSEPMPINVYEENGILIVEAALPGVTPDDVEVSCSDNVLTIRARAQVADREYLHQEMGYSDYMRQITLPGDCMFEQAEAAVEHGLLTVRVPKVRPRAPAKIRIQVNRKESSRTIDAEKGTGYSEAT
jgi:HSP20 family protein